jgi:ATP-dependent Clp protease protease subunit
MFSQHEEVETRKLLLKQKPPRIELANNVEGPMYTQVGQSLAFLRGHGSPELQIAISSGGGDVDIGLDIYDMIRLYPSKTTGLVINRAASMAAIILQACTVRQCAPHASILIHHISRRSVTLDQLRDSKKLKELRDDMEKSQDRLYKILQERTGQPLHKIKSVCAKDEYMDARAALKFGLIDNIV